jgi:hypothetical protein
MIAAIRARLLDEVAFADATHGYAVTRDSSRMQQSHCPVDFGATSDGGATWSWRPLPEGTDGDSWGIRRWP